MEPPRPRISVVIPARNSKETIGKCLDSLAALDRNDFEVIIIDDGSTDETAKICESRAEDSGEALFVKRASPDPSPKTSISCPLESFRNERKPSSGRDMEFFEGAPEATSFHKELPAGFSLKVMRVSQGGPSRARNVGVGAASGKLVAFTDADCIVDKNWLTELEKGFTGPDVAGVGGDQKSPEDETETGRLIQDFLKSIGFMTGYIKTGSRLKETEHNPTCNSMYRKKVLEEVGGFDESLWPGEDVDLDLKIRRRGYKLIFNPEACVGHYRPKTYRDFGRMMRRYGASQWYLVKKYGFFRKLHFVPVALLIGLAAFIGLLSWDPRFWPIIFLPWPLMFLWFYLKSRRIGKSLRFLYLFIITMVNWNWGFFQADSSTDRKGRPRIKCRG
ncbi:MAG: glycosyltransferase [Desulfomonile tiedjei]|nr:glycosyltransferase [Desulfomonile tiedjei]